MSDPSGETLNTAFPALTALLERHDFPEGTCWQRERYEPTATVITEGRYSLKAYLVLSGAARIIGSVAPTNDCRVKPGICQVGPGSMFGEFASWTKSPTPRRWPPSAKPNWPPSTVSRFGIAWRPIRRSAIGS